MTLIVITGASRGIGFSAAARLAAGGATVFAGARFPDELTTRLRADPHLSELDLRPLALDVTDDDSVAAAARLVAEATASIDELINNAAVPGTPAPPRTSPPPTSRPSSPRTCSARSA